MKFFILFLILLSVGCQSRRDKSEAIYKAQLEEIELARANNQITTAEYLRLKQDAQNQHENRMVPRGSSTFINNYQAPAPSTYQYKPIASPAPLPKFGGIPAFNR